MAGNLCEELSPTGGKINKIQNQVLLHCSPAVLGSSPASS